MGTPMSSQQSVELITPHMEVSKLPIDYGVKAHSRTEYTVLMINVERGNRIMVRIHFSQLL
jgi:hypothetical protein